MNDVMLPTIEELKKQRLESLMISEKAIGEHPTGVPGNKKTA